MDTHRMGLSALSVDSHTTIRQVNSRLRRIAIIFTDDLPGRKSLIFHSYLKVPDSCSTWKPMFLKESTGTLQHISYQTWIFLHSSSRTESQANFNGEVGRKIRSISVCFVFSCSTSVYSRVYRSDQSTVHKCSQFKPEGAQEVPHFFTGNTWIQT
jgi:hypothetical protein